MSDQAPSTLLFSVCSATSPRRVSEKFGLRLCCKNKTADHRVLNLTGVTNTMCSKHYYYTPLYSSAGIHVRCKKTT